MSRLTSLFTLLLAFCLFTSALGVKWYIPAYIESESEENRRCLMQYHPKETLLVGYVEAGAGDGQRIVFDIADTTPQKNKYYHKNNLFGRQKFEVTTHADAVVYFCFRNILDSHIPTSPQRNRTVNLHVDATGPESKDPSADMRKEKLTPLESELRRLEHFSRAIMGDLEFMKRREEEMRDTNEAANSRVALFGTLSIIALIGVTGWQVMYLKKFFQAKKA
ncbi:vesicle coat component [Rhizophlyctis rosea]|nr:vesicle coat component [Rhizophlyctis rosea]